MVNYRNLFVTALSLAAAGSALAQAGPQGEKGPDVPNFWVRPGYKVTLAASGLAQARFIVFDDKGNLYLSQPNEGKILVLQKKGEKYEVTSTFVSDRPTVHGMQWKDGYLWFTMSGSVYKARSTKNDGVADDIVTVIAEGTVPSKQAHFWRNILVTNDALYTGIGDSGNANDDDASADSLTRERQKIWKFDLDGKNKKLWSSGIRNTEKIMARPGTNEIWGIEHGTEGIGTLLGESKGHTPISDVHPEEEFNQYVEGGFYGHPYVEGIRFIRPEFANRKDIIELAEKTILPKFTFPAHYAITGWTFLSKSYFGADHMGDAFMASKGSTGRTAEKVGYGVERVMFDKLTGLPYGSWKIVTTLVDGQTYARPTDCAEAPDGSVFFTDDAGRKIYRISKAGK